METILLLGGNGFLGSNILDYVDTYLLNDYRVVVFDKFIRPEGLPYGCVAKQYAGDFSDELCLERIFRENTIDIVIHSISSTVPVSSFNAKYDIASNLLPSLSLFRIMIENGVKRVVYFSSGGAIYGNYKSEPHQEDEDVFPISSYGVVKLCVEKYMMQYALQGHLEPLILRLSNPYGRFHHSDIQGVCNVAMKYALQGKTFPIYGDGSALKDYILVDDVVKILFLLLTKGVHNQVINVASGRTYSVNNIVDRIRKMIPSFRYEYKEASVFDVSHFELNRDKLLSFIGDYAFATLEQGLESVYQWEKAQIK